MKIAIIGAGRLGSALGKRLAQAGHEVLYGGADAASSTQATGDRVTNARAAEFGEVVVLAVPFHKIGQAIDQTAGMLTGKVLWSCVNAVLPDASGLAIGFDTSAAEQVARHAQGARVVGALPPFADVLASENVTFGGHRPTVFLCSDDQSAKTDVARLIQDLSAEPVDAGPLTASRLVEPAMMLLVAIAYGSPTPRTVGLKLLER
jgi:8-hydroxy-5-deazaflavin:NADPH oxidoreductase